MVSFFFTRRQTLAMPIDKFGHSPLHRAVVCGKTAVIALLLKRYSAADVLRRDNANNTVLHLYRIALSRSSCCATSSCANPVLACLFASRSAAAHNRVPVCVQLIDYLYSIKSTHSVDDTINAINSAGNTALHIAVASGRPKTVAALMRGYVCMLPAATSSPPRPTPSIACGHLATRTSP